MTFAVDYHVVKQWDDGFTAEITIINNGSEAITDWTLGFDLPASIEKVWRADLSRSGSGSHDITGLSYSNEIPPGGSVTFGFKAAGDASVAPAEYTLAGTGLDDQPPAGDGSGSGDADDPAGDGGDGQPDPTPPDDGNGADNGAGGDGGDPSGSPVMEVAAGTPVSEIQALVDEAQPGTEIRLAAGEFVFDRPLVIDRDDIIVRGAGSDETTILADLEPGSIGPALYIDGGSPHDPTELREDAAEGDRTLVLGQGHGFQPGDFIWIEQPNTDAFLDEIGDSAWREDKPLRTSLARVTDVTDTGVVLEDGVHFDFAAGGAQVYRIDLVEDVTVGGFTITYPFGETDPGALENRLPEYDFTASVELDGAYAARVEDIQVHDAPSVGFNFLNSLRIEASDLLADGAHNKGTGGNGYAFQLKSVYESSFTELEDHGMRHSVVFGSWYSEVNNEVHVRFTDRDVNFHGGRDHGNVVHVESSERDPDTDAMSPTLSYNVEGERWGAPTDPDANLITFDRVLGSRRDDFMIKGSDDGAYLDGRGGDDALTGGAGDDTLIGGPGDDVLDGLGGRDTARFSGQASDYRFELRDDGTVSVRGPDDTDILRGIKLVAFEGGGPAISLGSLVDGIVPDNAAGLADAAGLRVEDGNGVGDIGNGRADLDVQVAGSGATAIDDLMGI